MTFQDVLQTILKVTGGPAYSKGLESAAKALDKHAEAEERGKERTKQLKEAFGELGGSSVLLAGEFTAVAAAVGESVKAFAEEEQVAFRVGVLLKNLGNTMPIEKAQQLAGALREGTSFSDKQTLSLIGLEKQFGVADDKVEGLAKTILDATKGNVKGLGLEEVSNAVLRGINGQTKGLKNLGIIFEDTGNKANNMLIIEQKLNNLFGGAAGAERNTLAGTFDALKASLEELFEAVGSKLATVIVPVLNVVVKVIDYLTDHVYLFTAALGAIAGNAIGGPVGALIGGLIGLGAGFLPGKSNPAAQVGNGKDRLATEATLQQIEQNTKSTQDAFIKAVLGGPGAVARTAFTARDARIAFGI